VALDNTVIELWHVDAVPVIAAGNALTVEMRVRIQPLGSMYVITALPAITPVTTPDDAFTVALATELLLQVPPMSELVSAVVEPSHTDAVPPITAGSAFVVATVVTIQPDGSV
jgi:hypothetical protein